MNEPTDATSVARFTSMSKPGDSLSLSASLVSSMQGGCDPDPARENRAVAAPPTASERGETASGRRGEPGGLRFAPALPDDFIDWIEKEGNKD